MRGISEGEAVSDGAGFFRSAGGECQVAVRVESLAELMCESAHGPTDVDFTDGVPFEFSVFQMKKGVDAERTEVVMTVEKDF